MTYKERVYYESGDTDSSESYPADLSQWFLTSSDKQSQICLMIQEAAAAFIFAGLFIFLWKRKATKARMQRGIIKYSAFFLHNVENNLRKNLCRNPLQKLFLSRNLQEND